MKNNHQSIIWLSSYPKSGNTWVRFILLNLVFGPQDTTEKLDVLIPDIHKCTQPPALPKDSHILVKTHHLLSESMPLYDYSAGFIYIVRNPMDVLISNLNYAYLQYNVGNDPAVREKLKQQYIEEYIINLGDSRWSGLGRGSWEEHIRSWITHGHDLPGLVIKYEDLLDNPLVQLGRICTFLNLDKTLAEQQQAIDNACFARMQTIEEKELSGNTPGFFLSENSDKSIHEGNRFMFRGMSGEGRKVLNEHQYERFIEQFRPAMEIAGYPLK